jgi:hypothetical protein
VVPCQDPSPDFVAAALFNVFKRQNGCIGWYDSQVYALAGLVTLKEKRKGGNLALEASLVLGAM